MKICVYAASLPGDNPEFVEKSTELGRLLAKQGIELVYGGGDAGLMGAVANGTLDSGGRVLGIIPRFMVEREWHHGGICECRVVETMHERKEMMMKEADALLALPGASGTFEELLEAITWKRLGLYHGRIIIYNIANYYQPMINVLNASFSEGLMNDQPQELWHVINNLDDLKPILEKVK